MGGDKRQSGLKSGEKMLFNVNEVCESLGIAQTKSRVILSDPPSGFTVKIGNRLYAHKKLLDEWLLNQVK